MSCAAIVTKLHCLNHGIGGSEQGNLIQRIFLWRFLKRN